MSKHNRERRWLWKIGATKRQRTKRGLPPATHDEIRELKHKGAVPRHQRR